MKLQNLAVIFIIIIMPIIIVFSEYMNTQLNIIKIEEQYDLNLLNSTYDAVKAFQINTINTMLYTSENRVKNAEASVNTFFSSLISSFKMEGNEVEVIKEYVSMGTYLIDNIKNIKVDSSQRQCKAII